MKKKNLLSLIPLIITSLLISGCGFYKNQNIEKTVLKQSINDYFDHNVYPLSNTPTIGEVNSLVLPIWFKDSNQFIASGLKESVKEDINKVAFGTKEELGWHSLKTYYEEESSGLLTLNGVVSDWYVSNKSFVDYGTDENATKELVKEAVNWYFNNNPQDSRKNYDYDKDGFLDSVIVIYGAADSTQRGMRDYDNLWAYTNWFGNKANKKNPVVNAFFWCSYDFFYGDNAFERTGNNFACGDTSNVLLDAHTLIHEQGHMFGLDDYYDYDGECSYAGGFSMQDHNVGGHDPFSVLLLGWASPYIPNRSSIIEIGTFQKTKDLILLSPSWNSYDSPFDEYLLLELYSPEGLNEFDSKHSYNSSYPKGSQNVGIRLWHVDGRLVDVAKSTKTKPVFTNNATLNNNLYWYATNNSSKMRKDRMPIEPLAGINMLQLIRNDVNEVINTDTLFDDYSLFYQGDVFTFSSYSKQFKNSTRYNNKKPFNWSFEVLKIENKNGEWKSSIKVINN